VAITNLRLGKDMVNGEGVRLNDPFVNYKDISNEDFLDNIVTEGLIQEEQKEYVKLSAIPYEEIDMF